MDALLMLLCSYRSTNVAYNLQSSNTFAEVVDYVCSKFSGLLPGNFELFYKIRGYNNFSLQNDVDLKNMVCLTRSFQLQLIDVVIEQHPRRDDNTPAIDPMIIQDQGTTGDALLNDFGMDDEVDLLQSFCPHKEKVFLSAPWAKGFTHIGQHFEGGASEFRNVLRKYVVECGFQIKFLKNDSVRVTAICAMNESKSCTWSVHGRKLEANRFFYLRKWNSEHICGVAVRMSTHPLVGSDLVADIVSERVRDRPLTRPTEVILDLKQDYGLDISYRVAWLGVEKARGELFGLFPLSYAVVDSENTSYWSWFLHHLAQVVHGDRPLTFVSDRNLGLLEVMPTVFPNAEYAFCLQHLQRNLRDRLRYTNSMHRAGLVSKLRHCTHAPIVTAFNHRVEQFQKSGRSVASEFLANAHPQHWANVFFRGRRYGEICSNAAESFNSWVCEARNLPITRMVDSIQTKLMRQMAKRRDASQMWTGTICPKIEDRLEKAFNEGRSWKVSQSNADVYEVHSFLTSDDELAHVSSGNSMGSLTHMRWLSSVRVGGI
ncbi:uncharacterized protein LOC114268558 [Camellia sinensis]|uniref:uncharacterized protein LOC114268558 n=1 Tax=Camellia sinensis TaxID=4442 RepID=UPI001036387C|nr:uncharacterized protein LOC114268558 [Camellia sinensis]